MGYLINDAEPECVVEIGTLTQEEELDDEDEDVLDYVARSVDGRLEPVLEVLVDCLHVVINNQLLGDASDVEELMNTCLGYTLGA